MDRSAEHREAHKARSGSGHNARQVGMSMKATSSSPEGQGRLVVLTGLPGSGKTALATELARSMPAVRMCPDDWMMSSGIDLWDSEVRARIERFQLTSLLTFSVPGSTLSSSGGSGPGRNATGYAMRHGPRAIPSNSATSAPPPKSCGSGWSNGTSRGNGRHPRSAVMSWRSGRKPTSRPTTRSLRPTTRRFRG